MRHRAFVLAAFLSLAPGCGDDGSDHSIDAAPNIDGMGQTGDGGSRFDLTVTISGYGQQENGNTIYFSLFEESGSVALANQTLTIMSGGGNGGGGGGGNNQVNFESLLEPGASYELFWYSDRDGDEACTGADRTFFLAIPEVTSDTILGAPHNTDNAGDCSRH